MPAPSTPPTGCITSPNRAAPPPPPEIEKFDSDQRSRSASKPSWPDLSMVVYQSLLKLPALLATGWDPKTLLKELSVTKGPDEVAGNPGMLQESFNLYLQPLLLVMDLWLKLTRRAYNNEAILGSFCPSKYDTVTILY